MAELILTMFFLNVVIYLINEIGADTINALLWHLYLKLPSENSRNVREQLRLKKESLELKRDMNNTSSQDEFAKWAKLRRRHDKSLEEYEEMNQKTSAAKASFDSKVRGVRWVSTSGLKIILQFYYTKTPHVLSAQRLASVPYRMDPLLSQGTSGDC
ncbi:hypothetical protein N7470_002948 [Penicillium chermesinum]|nr:hypothetical protein N7470_002948 [Penicillium chermesinum]